MVACSLFHHFDIYFLQETSSLEAVDKPNFVYILNIENQFCAKFANNSICENGARETAGYQV